MDESRLNQHRPKSNWLGKVARPDSALPPLTDEIVTWHEAHQSAVRALKQGVRQVAHTAVETYSVLNARQGPQRLNPRLSEQRRLPCTLGEQH
jgi:hypothetical protein